jgi:hypothetical protein
MVGILTALITAPLWTAVAGGPDNRPGSARFGVVEAFYRPDDARELGVGWERIIFEWARFQPDGPGDFNTDAVPEEWLIEAQSAGREVVGLLKNTPLWASDIQELGAPPNGLDLPIDDPGNVWAAFVMRTVTYYGEEWDITTGSSITSRTCAPARSAGTSSTARSKTISEC